MSSCSSRLKKAALLEPQALVSRIQKCSSLRDLKPIHAAMMRSGSIDDYFLASKLIESSALALSGQVGYSHRILSATHRPNAFMWNTVIRGYSVSDSPLRALSLFRDMRICGILPNSFTFGFVLKACCGLLRLQEGREVHGIVLKMGFDSELPVINGLIRMYVNCECVEMGRALFDEMRERDSGSWSVMVTGYARNGCSREVLALFRDMQMADVEIDGFTLATVVGVCGDMGALDLGKWIHSYIDRNNVRIDVVLGTALVDMYAKCGGLEEALRVFEEMVEKDVMAWSTMIGGCAIHGYGRKALEMFARMKKCKVTPTCVTFTSVLCACSHSGLLDEGRKNFDSMQKEYGIKPQIEHYGCMVDLYCRAGLVHEANNFIKNMSIEPNVVLWRTLLGACRLHGEVQLGEQVCKRILELEPNSGENYVLISNVYASQGRWLNVNKVRSLMKDNKANKLHGWSSIEVDFTVHEFVMGDDSHPESEEIYKMLDKIGRRLKQAGYIATTKDVLHDIDEEEKVHALALHSERLAIAYGLLSTSEGTHIRIVKNLRVCSDCHTVMKVISQVYHREITIRDRVRFHHFSGGKCSCHDYW